MAKKSKASKFVAGARATGYAAAKGVKTYEGYKYGTDTQGLSSADAAIATVKADLGVSMITGTFSTDVVWDRWKYVAGWACADFVIDKAGGYKHLTKLLNKVM